MNKTRRLRFLALLGALATAAVVAVSTSHAFACFAGPVAFPTVVGRHVSLTCTDAATGITVYGEGGRASDGRRYVYSACTAGTCTTQHKANAWATNAEGNSVCWANVTETGGSASMYCPNGGDDLPKQFHISAF
jgi:hypothetical protein